MDLIHADENLAEIGFVKEIVSFDAEVSQELDATIEDNTFALVLSDKVWEADPVEIGHYVYVPDTEFGGCVEQIKHSTAQRQVTVSGATWRGALYRKIIVPGVGDDYVTITSEEANDAIDLLAGGILGTAYSVSAANSGITIISKAFRYTNLLLGIEDMLNEEDAALEITFSQSTKTAILSARAVTDYSSTVDLSQDYNVDMVTTEGGYDRYNHVIALGAGVLSARDIVHVYRNTDGTITYTPPAWADTAADHVMTYDYNNAETSAILQHNAELILMERAPYNMAELDPQVEGLATKLGDSVGARDRLTGMSATVTVVGKILTMSAANGIRLETRVT
jgi:hypothetical protein